MTLVGSGEALVGVVGSAVTLVGSGKALVGSGVRGSGGDWCGW